MGDPPRTEGSTYFTDFYWGFVYEIWSLVQVCQVRWTFLFLFQSEGVEFCSK
jgi:hypothetical protein